MKKKLQEMLTAARKLEVAIASRVEGSARRVSGSVPIQPLEIVHAIVQAVDHEIQPAGRGRRGFPFNKISVSLRAETPQRQAQLEQVCAGPPSLQQRITDRLQHAGCQSPDLTVDVACLDAAGSDWRRPDFHVAFAKHDVYASAHGPVDRRISLTVTNGGAQQAAYSFSAPAVTFGRGAEVRDNRHRLIRMNDVAFADDGNDVNQTVSRRHARLEHDHALGAYRLFDDGSAQGTVVIRRGRGHEVPRGTKGMLVRAGDEIALGQARIRVDTVS